MYWNYNLDICLSPTKKFFAFHERKKKSIINNNFLILEKEYLKWIQYVVQNILFSKRKALIKPINLLFLRNRCFEQAVFLFFVFCTPHINNIYIYCWSRMKCVFIIFFHLNDIIVWYSVFTIYLQEVLFLFDISQKLWILKKEFQFIL